MDTQRRAWRVPVVLFTAAGLCACLVSPLPASRERTRYDTLAGEKPGTVSAAALEQRYGPPHLTCADNRLWVYGWSVGHGGGIALFNPVSATFRLYYSFHIAFVWLDENSTLSRLELAQLERHVKRPPRQASCVSGGTCVRPEWSERLLAVKGLSTVVCGADWYDPKCWSWTLHADSVVEVNGEPAACSAGH